MSRPDQAYQPNLSYQSFGNARGGSDSERKLEAIQLPDLRGKRFLDLGCNAGFFCAHARAGDATRVVGIDNSTDVIEVARERHPDIEFFDTGWDRIPDGEFDVIICLSAVHYAEDQVRLARDIHSHLSDDGLFVLEGGLVDQETLGWTDLPAIAFRKVGDRVRHLSTGFLQRHMLTRFEWTMIGPSIQQGGDPIPRVAIHARKAHPVDGDAQPEYRLCPVEYARALALCADSIQEKQASYSYVTQLGAAPVPLASADVVRVLAKPEALTCFAIDVAFALKAHGKRLELRDSLGGELTGRLAALMRDRKIAVSGPPTGKSKPELTTRPENGVADIEGPTNTPFANMVNQCNLAGAKVADLSGPNSDLWPMLLEAGAAEVHLVTAADRTSPDPRVTIHAGQPWEIDEGGFDYVFFDATAAPDFDHVNDVARLARSLLQGGLAPDGVAYVTFRIGRAQSNWDLYNRILMSPLGPLPSGEYLYSHLLRDFAARPQQSIPPRKEHKRYSDIRLVKLVPRRPTLLVVAGPSQSGKTTLARKLLGLPDTVHFSSDYIYIELSRIKQQGDSLNCSQDLKDAVGGGAPDEVGNFFRTIEKRASLFEDYLRLVAGMMPRDKGMITLDLDVRRPKRIKQLKEFFAEAGFSVWVITR